MKVKIIYDHYMTELEKRINEFIQDKIIYGIEFKDGNNFYSVLIKYEEGEE